MTIPIATTCMAVSEEIPNKPHATGINSSDPPATPDAPHAVTTDTTDNTTIVKKSTSIFNVFTVAKVKMVMVTAAPAILMVAPSGMDTLAVDSETPRRFAKSKFTGIFAAELRVKNAVIPLSSKHLNTNGYGFFFITMATKIGLITNATKAIVATKTTIKCA